MRSFSISPFSPPACQPAAACQAQASRTPLRRRAGNRPGPSSGCSSSPELRLPREPSLGLSISPESRLPSDFLLGLLLGPARGDCASSLLMSAAASNWLNKAASSAGMAWLRAGAHLFKHAGSISLLGSELQRLHWLISLQCSIHPGSRQKGQPVLLKQGGAFATQAG